MKSSRKLRVSTPPSTAVWQVASRHDGFSACAMFANAQPPVGVSTIARVVYGGWTHVPLAHAACVQIPQLSSGSLEWKRRRGYGEIVRKGNKETWRRGEGANGIKGRTRDGENGETGRMRSRHAHEQNSRIACEQKSKRATTT